MKIFSLIIVLALPLTVCSQSFVPGYVITNQKDTIRGTINYQSAASKVCIFKKTGNSQLENYGVDDISGYGIENGKTFLVKKLPVDSSRREILFTEILVRGRASLYRYDNSFFIEKDSIYLLEQSTRQVLDQKVKYEVVYEQTTKKYVGILNYLFLDCPGMSASVMKARLEEGALTKLTVKYNSCVGGDNVEFKKQTRSWKVGFAVYAAENYIRLRGGVSNYGYIGGDYFNAAIVSPSLGVGALISNPKEADRFFGTIDLELTPKASMKGTAHTEGPIYFYDDDFTFSYTRIRIPFGVKLILKSGKVSPYGRVGYCFNAWFNGHVSGSHKSTVHGQPDPISTVPYDYDITSFRLGQFWFSTGLQFNQFKGLKGFLELRAEMVGGNSNAAVFTTGPNTSRTVVIDGKSIKTQTYSLTVGILL